MKLARIPRMALLPPVVLLLAACASKHPGSYTTAATTTKTGAADAIVAAADEAWKSRADEARLQAALEKYAEAHAVDPGNRHVLVRLTRGWYFWGDAFTDVKETKVERWGKAIEWGARCLALNADFAELVNQGTRESEAIERAGVDDVPCIYWTATALGKWGKIQSLSKTLKHLPTVKAYVSRVEALQPAFYHYGPARYWGAYYSALPSFAGRDFEKSAQYFEAAIEGAPYYLPTRALRAEFLAVGTQDVAMFDEDTSFVLDSDPDAKPEAGITAENLKEQDKIRLLQAKRSELFDKKALDAVAND